ncbi:hypothetical protein RFI_27409 [Reticulomyxa filosa]|uniref:Uncharacterized protein n=1 Tax=Reticulomyxa filosa TaxID=46433 RepID=X6M917_RETFI|nr:hypothetical protein RFI_27409 [Reticulomyxa filosa]|eukprot:ETO09967.1 hypothetical protein RFI_27409 [Reticulomyxa filosa]
MQSCLKIFFFNNFSKFLKNNHNLILKFSLQTQKKRKKLSDDENDDLYQAYQHNSKRQKIEPKVPQLEKNKNNTKCNLNEEKKDEKVNENNVRKKSRKIRRQYFCTNFPTLVITPVKGRTLLSTSSLIRFIFNDTHSKELVQNFSKDDNEVQFITSKCFIFQILYQEEAKKKIEDLNNPNVNRYVLIKIINIRESEKGILESLAGYKYNIQEIQRLKGLAIVKVLMS